MSAKRQAITQMWSRLWATVHAKNCTVRCKFTIFNCWQMRCLSLFNFDGIIYKFNYSKLFMRRSGIILLGVVLFSGALMAQLAGPSALAVEGPMSLLSGDGGPRLAAADASVPNFVSPVALPRMSPELALDTFQRRSARQAQELAGFSSATVVRADLPRSSQHGELQLERHYSVPRSLTFKTLHFVGDGFVKSNVIARLLQSEVDHVQKDDPALTAIRLENYKFSHKHTTQIAGHVVHVYQVKPRKKRPGLFKGHIYLDAYTGSLVRAEGRANSPSLFVKKIDFVQDFADVNGYTIPTHIHSEAKAAIVGTTVVDIVNSDCQPVLLTTTSAGAAGSR